MPATLFPGAIDTFNNPLQSTGLADVGYEHDLEHDKENDAILALETKMGQDFSPITASIDYVMKHHSHTGADGSAALTSLVAQPVTDGNVLILKTAGGTAVITASTVAAGPALLVQPPQQGGQGLVLKAAGATPTADMLQVQTSAGVVESGIGPTGTIYGYQGLVLYKGAGGVGFLNTVPASGEVDLVNGAILKGFTGAIGTGQQLALDASQGSLLLGGPSSGPTIRLNAFRTNRQSTFQMDGDNAANLGGLNWQQIVDADAQLYGNRLRALVGNLQKTADGSAGPSEPFVYYGFPTYDGVSTATKGMGISVVPASTPVLTAGTVTITGALTLSGLLTLSSATNFAAPSVQSLPGDLAAVGAASTFARSDHVHFREQREVIQSAIVYSAGPSGGNTTSTTYVTLTGLPAVTYVKVRSDTKLVLTQIASGWNGLSGNTAIRADSGVQVNGVNYAAGFFFFNLTGVHTQWSGMATISGLVSGNVTLQPVVKCGGAGMQFNVDSNDVWTLKVEEVL